MNNVNSEELHAAMFAQMVMQQANLAMMLLGKTPNPETGETMRDLEAAQVFINQLEMLEAKTKGNLTPPEAALLKQTLMSLRMTFVEAVNEPATATSQPAAAATPAVENKTPPTEAASGEDSGKRFSKKYPS
jgi:uncharacterized membrane protein YccC